MRLEFLNVVNYRAIKNCSLNIGPLTAVLGENNSGKSAFLSAIEVFFSSAPKLEATDFHQGNTDDPIEITVRFGSLTAEERERFGNQLTDGKLTVTRVFRFNGGEDSGKFFVAVRAFSRFNELRNFSGSKTELRAAYNKIREELGRPNELPAVNSADQIDGCLLDWEQANPDMLTLERVSSFRGWANVASGLLKKKTTFVLIRAVQKAQDELHSEKSSPVKQLLDAVARQTLQNKKEFKEFITKATDEVRAITDPVGVPLLAKIGQGMTQALNNYYGDSIVQATWDPVEEVSIKFPSAEIRVESNSFVSVIDKVGHGLQRAVLLSALQYLAEYAVDAEIETDMQAARQDEATEGGELFEEAQSDLVIAIEEPELFQHPTKQRLFRKAFRKLSHGFNARTGIRTQIIFVSHSPLMVDIERCEEIRLVKWKESDSGAKLLSISEVSLGNCNDREAGAMGLPDNDRWPVEAYRGKLHVFDSKCAEGFFGRAVIIVEGVGDQAVLEAIYESKGRDALAEGVVIVVANGKRNIIRLAPIFEDVGIPVFTVFDNDSGKGDAGTQRENVKCNRAIQMLFGTPSERVIDWPAGVEPSFSAFSGNLEAYIESVSGSDLFAEQRSLVAQEFSIQSKDCLKAPRPAGTLIRGLIARGNNFDQLDRIILAVDELLGAPSPLQRPDPHIPLGA